MHSTSLTLYNALIRTHHITSRKKVARLKKAAHHYMANGFILIRSGGCPGYMYAEGEEGGIKEWIASVQVYGLGVLLHMGGLVVLMVHTEAQLQRLSTRLPACSS